MRLLAVVLLVYLLFGSDLPASDVDQIKEGVGDWLVYHRFLEEDSIIIKLLNHSTDVSQIDNKQYVR